jgi:hypothetical protein
MRSGIVQSGDSPVLPLVCSLGPPYMATQQKQMRRALPVS